MQAHAKRDKMGFILRFLGFLKLRERVATACHLSLVTRFMFVLPGCKVRDFFLFIGYPLRCIDVLFVRYGFFPSHFSPF